MFKPVSPDGTAPALNDPALFRAEDSDTTFLTNRFLETMPAYADEGKGWFAHLTYLRPHPPLVAPETEDAVHGFLVATRANSKVSSFVEGFRELELTDETVRTLRSIYLGLATEVDHHIGRVVQLLKENGQYDNTLLVVTADNGEMLGDRDSWGRMSVYDAACHTPLIIHLPEGDRGARVTAPTESIDIKPTILEWVGQTVPDAKNGRSQLPILYGERPSNWRKYTFFELDLPTHWNQHAGSAI